MTRFLIIVFVWISLSLSSQVTLNKDSFFPMKKPFPENYKSLMADSDWQTLGYYKSNQKKIILPDTITVGRIELFEDGKSYRKIKGKKIISNLDISTVEIIYIDSTTLILENKYKKTVHRTLYRRKT